jgi:glycosyltransferase involved in cell wall biosynthesis
VRYLRHEQNGGAAAARNTGIRASAGEYIAFLDSDDEWLPEKLERQIELFRRSPERVGLVYTGTLYVWRDRWRPPAAVSPAHRGRLYRELLLRNVVGGASTAMVRRNVLARVGGFEELPAWEDLDLWLRIAEHFDIEFVPEPLVRVYKQDSANRLTRDVAKREKAIEMFYRKHRTGMERERVAHLYLRRAAWLYHRPSVANMPAARQYYLASIRARPGSLLSYLMLLSTYVPRSLYKAGATFRRSARLLTRHRGSAAIENGAWSQDVPRSIRQPKKWSEGDVS